MNLVLREGSTLVQYYCLYKCPQKGQTSKCWKGCAEPSSGLPASFCLHPCGSSGFLFFSLDQPCLIEIEYEPRR